MSYPGHSVGGGLTPLQRSSHCIQQPQPAGQGIIGELEKFSFLNDTCIGKIRSKKFNFRLSLQHLTWTKMWTVNYSSFIAVSLAQTITVKVLPHFIKADLHTQIVHISKLISLNHFVQKWIISQLHIDHIRITYSFIFKQKERPQHVKHITLLDIF